MMKINNIFSLLLLCVMAYAVTACIEDDSLYGDNPIPTLTVTTNTTEDGELPQLNFYSGSECVITPQINYDGSGTLQYEWSVGTYEGGVKGELEFVSNDRELRLTLPAGGVYYAHLNATDGVVGVVQEYQINVNRTFEQGYILIANDKDGSGNLTFIKDLTPEEIENGIESVIVEHSIESVNENIQSDNLAGVTILRPTWPRNAAPRLIATYGSTSYFLDPNTFMVISTISHDAVIPGFKAKNLIGMSSDPYVHDSSTNRYINLLYSDMIGVEKNDIFKDFKFDLYKFYTEYSYSWGQSYDNYFVNRSPVSVSVVGFYYGVITTDELRNKDGYPLLQGHTFNNFFVGETSTYEVDYGSWGIFVEEYNPGYLITQQSGTGKYFFTRLQTDSYATSLDNQGHAEIPTTADTAIPDVETTFAVSNTYKRTYYQNGNKVYVMLTNGDNISWPNKSQSVLTFPSDEEITYMTVNASTNELLVATADKSTGRGSLYIYDVADVRTDTPNPSPKKHYADCSDRISYITYKPRL